VGDDSEEGSWVARPGGQQSAPAAVHWGEECWESEESEEECEFTDGEEDDPEGLGFNENAFQKLFTGVKNIYFNAQLVIIILAAIQLLKEVAMLAVLHVSLTSLHRKDVCRRKCRHGITV
jgi:hypothetical protein